MRVTCQLGRCQRYVQFNARGEERNVEWWPFKAGTFSVLPAGFAMRKGRAGERLIRVGRWRVERGVNLEPGYCGSEQGSGCGFGTCGSRKWIPRFRRGLTGLGCSGCAGAVAAEAHSASADDMNPTFASLGPLSTVFPH